MAKVNLFEMYEVIQIAQSITKRTEKEWNKTCKEVYNDSPDGVAFAECHIFEYNKKEVLECLQENPKSLFYKSLKQIMTEEKINKLKLTA